VWTAVGSGVILVTGAGDQDAKAIGNDAFHLAALDLVNGQDINELGHGHLQPACVLMIF
jgi:hypothetical protein